MTKFIDFEVMRRVDHLLAFYNAEKTTNSFEYIQIWILEFIRIKTLSFNRYSF